MRGGTIRRRRVRKFALFILGDAADLWLEAPHPELGGARPIDAATAHPDGLVRAETLLTHIYNRAFKFPRMP